MAVAQNIEDQLVSGILTVLRQHGVVEPSDDEDVTSDDRFAMLSTCSSKPLTVNRHGVVCV